MREDIPVNDVHAKDLCPVHDLDVVVPSFHNQDFPIVACRVHTDHVHSVHLHSDKILCQAGRNTGHPESADIEDPARDPVALDLGSTLTEYHSSESNAEEKRIGDVDGVQPDSVNKVLLRNLVQEVAFASHTETVCFDSK